MDQSDNNFPWQSCIATGFVYRGLCWLCMQLAYSLMFELIILMSARCLSLYGILVITKGPDFLGGQTTSLCGSCRRHPMFDPKICTE